MHEKTFDDEYGKHLAETNYMQMDLVIRKSPNRELDDISLAQWQKKNSIKFHELMAQHVLEDPNIWEEIKDKAFYEKFLTEMENDLDHAVMPLQRAA